MFDEVVDLRVMRDNLTDYTTTLYEQEASMEFGSFAERLQAMQDDMVTLMEYVSMDSYLD